MTIQGLCSLGSREVLKQCCGRAAVKLQVVSTTWIQTELNEESMLYFICCNSEAFAWVVLHKIPQPNPPFSHLPAFLWIHIIYFSLQGKMHVKLAPLKSHLLTEQFSKLIFFVPETLLSINTNTSTAEVSRYLLGTLPYDLWDGFKCKPQSKSFLH